MSASRVRPGVPLRPRATAALAVAGVIGVLTFAWPLLIAPASPLSGRTDVPLMFALVLPLVLVVVVAELADGGLDAKVVALLGVLTAVGVALRPLGTGIAGLEPTFFLLILGGRAFGAGFGFLLGAMTLFASALVTGGVGPWLPYQMLAAAGVGAGAGLLPAARGRGELAMLAGYGAMCGLLFGLAMNLSFWPFAIGADTVLSFDPTAPLGDNLRRFLLFTAATSLAFDVPRAVLTAALVAWTGGPILRTLRRAGRRAAFGAQGRFVPDGLNGPRRAARRASSG
jgi:energy-coupling factor transport system substrate-specific component